MISCISGRSKTRLIAAPRAGARGYILKYAGEDEIIRAIRAVKNGEAIFSPAIASQLIDYFSSSKKIIPEEVFPELTEREILDMIVRDRANFEISDQLSISLKTVRNHVSNIFSKL